jgi:hypothetical protein
LTFTSLKSHIPFPYNKNRIKYIKLEEEEESNKMNYYKKKSFKENHTNP